MFSYLFIAYLAKLSVPHICWDDSWERSNKW